MPSPVLTESEIRTLWYRYGDFGVQLNPDGSIISKTDRTDSTIARIKAGAVAGDELAQRWIALRITNRMSK